MRHSITPILLVFITINAFSQNTEFNKSSNGLIYSETTVQQLKHIVDSLNLKFKICDVNRIYQSKFQAKANYITLDTGDINEARKDIEANIPYEDFIKKHPFTKTEKDLLVVRFKYIDYYDKDIVEFSSIGIGNTYGHNFKFSENLDDYIKPLLKKWIFYHHKKSDYSKESIQALYFTEELTQRSVPVKYSRMIQYSECMVDTSTQVFYDKAKRSGVRYSVDEPSKLKNFMTYAHNSNYSLESKTGKNNQSQKDMAFWDSVKFSQIDSLKTKDAKFYKLLNEAVKDVMKNGGSNDEFEDYVGHYYSKEAELELKRNRIVVGGCSMDNSPRIHALNIAKLSAETVNWEIFLRSHLDIMNDRFERASDGSYAWGRRKTYIRELEVLDINVPDLLLGIILRVENPSNNHYYGSINRIGRALSESGNSGEIEEKMFQMISDNELDDYNRILIYYLFLNYNYNIENKEKQAENKTKLMTVVKALPEYLSIKILSEK